MDDQKNQCETCSEKSDKCDAGSCEKIQKLPQNQYNEIKHVVGVMSGKGGVGKSSVTALLAMGLKKQGFNVGILDADITGPSIPKIFGATERPGNHFDYLLPVSSATGIKLMSINLLLPNEDDPVIWRGPILAGAVKQFWTDVAWGRLDYLIVDLPPGTGDVPLTTMQSLPLDGMVVVTSPQKLAQMVVRKAIKMAAQLDVPVLGMVENMSYLTCPDCGKKIDVFGPSQAEEVSFREGIKLLEILPIDPKLAELCDQGRVEQYETEAFTRVTL
ncbi:nucleotide-binding protein [Desulfocucumis palustris]|uniref:Iron-sulfur cluster carrier protein n=1 Tax=Desulfocucumis palustris TaxID=1898651 RepID=A0A2L2X6Z2_9FIRM|nr:Mrp/NBP35 family ATP-binding protein [Desulfocucumis palustris]GBF31935.1 nucleotide-binding protein [Desulfocucumis palustris]